MNIDLLWPTCAICNKKVDHLEFMNVLDTNEVVVIVKCHGLEDKCSLEKHTLIFNSISPGYAFNTKKIEFDSIEIKKLTHF